jgi:hypothetical protein
MSGWLYEDKSHSEDCVCDACDGERFLERHVPDECLFDDNDRNHRYRDQPKQKRKGWWE